MLYTINTRDLTECPIARISFSLITRKVRIKWYGYNQHVYKIRRRDQLKIIWREIREPRSVRYGQLANWIIGSDLT